MVEIKKLRAGKAKGADDLHTWAFRRKAGLSGVPNAQQQKRAKRKAKRFERQKLKRERRLASERLAFEASMNAYHHASSKLIKARHE